MPVRAWASDAPQAPWSPVIGPGRRSPPGPKAPVKGSVGWSPGAARAQGGVEAPGASPGGARRPPTTRLALTSVTSLGGGDLYRAGGARQGATPPSTPDHEGRYTYIHVYIYIQSRGPSPCHHPAGQVVGAILHAGHGGLAPLAAQRLHPFSLIPSPPRRLPFAHLSLPTGECSGPTETGVQSPRRRGPPWLTALPANAHDARDGASCLV